MEEERAGLSSGICFNESVSYNLHYRVSISHMWQVSMITVASAPEEVQVRGGTEIFINCTSFEQPRVARDCRAGWCRNRATTYRPPSLFVNLLRADIKT